MRSTAQKLTLVSGLLDTTDLSDWEQGFVKSCVERGAANLSDKQLETLDRIHDKHFA